MTYFLVKFCKKQGHSDDFVRGRIFANRLSKFKQTKDDDESGRVDRNEGTIAWLQPGKGRLTINGIDVSARSCRADPDTEGLVEPFQRLLRPRRTYRRLGIV